MRNSLSKIAICATLLVVPISAAGTASAQSLDGPLIETTCSYAQLQAALQVEAPQASARLAERPGAQAKLQELVALPVDQRKQRVQRFLERNPDVATMIEQRRNTPEGQEKLQLAARVAETCQRY